MISLRLAYGEEELAFLSTVATFGTPLDVTVAELAIESFFPANPITAAALHSDWTTGGGGIGTRGGGAEQVRQRDALGGGLG